MNFNGGPSQQNSSRFASTRWSMVLKAGSNEGAAGRTAFGELCEAYWFPLYAYVRRRGFDADAAKDLTQGFFTYLLEKGNVKSADPNRGRFRSFLLTALQHYLANEQDRANAVKRGGRHTTFAVDFAVADRRYQYELHYDDPPEKSLTRNWAFELVDRAFELLAAEATARGRGQTFDRLVEFLSGERSSSYREAAADLGISVSAVKVGVHRLRRRLQEILRAEIADTVEDPGAVDEELRELFAALRP